MIKLKKTLDNAAGKLCEVLFPIRHEYYIGKGKSVAICTLSSIDLLETIANVDYIMSRILIVDRLLSENKGLDTIINFTLNHPAMSQIIVCSKEVKGHRTGQALLSLHRNGASPDGRIIEAVGPYPFLTCGRSDVESFRSQTSIYDLTDCEDLETIKTVISNFY